jgi:hypothetical protein
LTVYKPVAFYTCGKVVGVIVIRFKPDYTGLNTTLVTVVPTVRVNFIVAFAVVAVEAVAVGMPRTRSKPNNFIIGVSVFAEERLLLNDTIALNVSVAVGAAAYVIGEGLPYK